MTAPNVYDAFIDNARTRPTQELVDTIRAITALPTVSREEHMVRAASITALRERYPAVEAAFTAAVGSGAVAVAVLAAIPS